MKFVLISLFAALLGLGFVFAPIPTAPSGELTWETNFETAVKKAKKEKKKLLLNFTGSDWCGWCIRLDKEVFSKKEFIEYAEKNLVCVKLDFPKRKELSEDEKKQNYGLASEFKVTGFPTIYITDIEKKAILKTGYIGGDAQQYVEHLDVAIQKESKEKGKKNSSVQN
jgi:protein disulfide-isomerase